MSDPGNEYPVFRVIDVRQNPVISDADSVSCAVQFFGIRPAGVFADFLEFINDAFAKYPRHPGEFFIRAGSDSHFITFHQVPNVHHVHYVVNGPVDFVGPAKAHIQVNRIAAGIMVQVVIVLFRWV
jgi:hypothetical protein